LTVNSYITGLVLVLVTPPSIALAGLWAAFDRRGNGPHLVARWWARLLLWVSLVKVEVRGMENLDAAGTYVFAANHSSMFDILVLLGYLPFQFRWLAKEELFHIPGFGWAMRKAGYIPINRTNPREGVQSLKVAAEKIEAGTSVVIFPEGTRSKDGRIQDFKRGGFTIAVRSGRPIVPVSISGAARVLPSKTLALRPGRIKVVLGRPIPTAGLDRVGQADLMDQVKSAITSNFDPEYGSD